MKKVLLSLMLIGSFIFGKAQAVLNEIYFNPSSGESEYIEIYNSGAFTDLNCYTLVIKYNDGTNSGFYVINYPNISLNSNTFSVAAASLPFSYQAGTYSGGAKDFSWNSLNAAGTGGYFKQFQKTGSTYTEVTPPVNTNDILQTLPSGDGAKYITLLYNNGVLANGLIINGGTTVPAGLTGMPDLVIPNDASGASCGFTAHFSTIQSNELEYMTPAIGSSNGAFRTSDGKCGTWQKASNKTDNTPGKTNGPSTITDNTVITVGGSSSCVLPRTANYFVVNSATSSTAYPLVLQLYLDNGTTPGQLDASDQFVEQQAITTAPANGTPDHVYTANIPASTNGSIIVVAKATSGCFQTIQQFGNTCTPLPVKFSSFTATRSNPSSVSVAWTTAQEQNSKGFYVQKNVNGVWTNVAYVPSQAIDGNSISALNYSYVDMNSDKGITQYRVQQVDLDGKFAYTDIKAIRGEGTVGKVILYPNPSSDGKVNVVFEDNTAIRDVQVNDMQGKVVRSFKGVSNNILTIEKLTTGFYTIKVINRTTNASSVHKVVIK